MALKIVARTPIAETIADEPALIAAAQGGDQNAFHQLYEYYRDRIFNLIRYSIRDAHQAEDVFQTVFLKIFQALPTFRGDCSFLTWIYQIALNECKNANRNRRIWTSLSDIFGDPQERDRRPSPDVLHSTEQRKREIQRAISTLKPKYREVVLLKYIEEFSYEEVARILKLSPGTIASRLHRAMKILESLL